MRSLADKIFGLGLRAHSIITSHFGISPSGYLCPMPHSQTHRNS
jgi:hypothetical protein